MFQVDNSPRAGFAVEGLVGVDPCASQAKPSEFEKEQVLVRHPDGFLFTMRLGKFMRTIWDGAVSGGELQGEFSLAWDFADRQLVFVRAGTDRYDECAEATAAFASVEKDKFLKKSELRPGGVYAKKDGSRWMYVGEYDTYSFFCHRRALADGRYPDRPDDGGGWRTAKAQQVFRRADSGKGRGDYAWAAFSSTAGIFVEEAEPPESRKTELAAARASAARSPAFNRIDLARGAEGPSPMAFSDFKRRLDDWTDGYGVSPGYKYPESRCRYMWLSGGKYLYVSRNFNGWSVEKPHAA